MNNVPNRTLAAGTGSTVRRSRGLGVSNPSPRNAVASAAVGNSKKDSAVREQQRAASQKLAYQTATAGFFTAVESLAQLVGVPLTAYLSDVNDTRAVLQWIRGDRVPHPATQSKIQMALQIAVFLQEEGEQDVIAAWFKGLNPTLNDRTPAELIHAADTADLSAVGRRVLAAAREFVYS